MKDGGKIACTTLETIKKALGCSVEEAISKNAEDVNNLSKQKNNLMGLK